jgi:hypothetical protein
VRTSVTDRASSPTTTSLWRAGSDGTQALTQALDMATAYKVDPWRVHFSALAALLSSLPPSSNPPRDPPSDPDNPVPGLVLATLTQHMAPLLDRPAHLLWTLFVLVLPGLSDTAPLQWLLFVWVLLEALPRALQAAPPPLLPALHALHAFVRAEVAGGSAAGPLVAPLVTAGVCAVLGPLWPHLDCPLELVSGPQDLPHCPPSAPSAAVFAVLSIDSAAAVRRALEHWPPAPEGPLSPGPCGVSAAIADTLIVVKLLSGGAPVDIGAAEVVTYCKGRLSALSREDRTSILEWLLAAGACPGAQWGEPPAPPAPVALPIHSKFLFQLLEATRPPLGTDPSPAAAAAARRLRVWHVITNALATVDSIGPGAQTQDTPLVCNELDEVAMLAEAAQCATCTQHGAAIAAHGVLQAGAALPAVAMAARGVFAALDRDEEASSDHDEAAIEGVLSDVYQDHMEAALAAVRAEVAGACEAQGGLGGSKGMWDVEKAIDSLSGTAAKRVPQCSALRDAVLAALQRLHAGASGVEVQHPLMHALVQLQVGLSSPEKWGEFQGGGGPVGILKLQTRSALAPCFGDEAVPPDVIVTDMASAAALLTRLLPAAAGNPKLLWVLFGVLKQVWRFGAAFDSAVATEGGVVLMHGSCQEVAIAFAQAGCVIECSNMLHWREEGTGGVLLEDGEAQEVVEVLERSAGHIVAVGAALGSGMKGCVSWGVQALQADLLGEGVEACEEATALLLYGLCMLPMATLQGLMCEGAMKRLVGGLARSLPHVSASPGLGGMTQRVQCAFAFLLSTLCTSGGSGTILIAAEMAAEYVAMHPGLRRTSAEVAALKRYLTATRLRVLASGSPTRGSGNVGDELAEVLPRAGGSGIIEAIDDALAAVEQACVKAF